MADIIEVKVKEIIYFPESILIFAIQILLKHDTGSSCDGISASCSKTNVGNCVFQPMPRYQ